LPCYHGCKKHYGPYFSSPFCSKTFVFFFSFFWSYSHGCKKSGMFINHNPFFKQKSFGGSSSFSYCHGLLLVCFFFFFPPFLFSYLFYSHGCKTERLLLNIVLIGLVNDFFCIIQLVIHYKLNLVSMLIN
jgi:hypothetical protein